MSPISKQLVTLCLAHVRSSEIRIELYGLLEENYSLLK